MYDFYHRLPLSRRSFLSFRLTSIACAPTTIVSGCLFGADWDLSRRSPHHKKFERAATFRSYGLVNPESCYSPSMSRLVRYHARYLLQLFGTGREMFSKTFARRNSLNGISSWIILGRANRRLLLLCLLSSSHGKRRLRQGERNEFLSRPCPSDWAVMNV